MSKVLIDIMIPPMLVCNKVSGLGALTEISQNFVGLVNKNIFATPSQCLDFFGNARNISDLQTMNETCHLKV